MHVDHKIWDGSCLCGGCSTLPACIPTVPSFTEGWQLEAQVHTSLPPLVKGVLRGYLRVCVEGVAWDYSIGPPAPKLSARLKWWGEQSTGTLFR